MREMRVCHPAEDLNFGFQDNPDGVFHTTIETQMAGGLVVMAATMDSPIGKVPALVFKFAKPDGITFFDDMTLVLDKTAMLNTGSLVQRAATTAVKAAKN
mgnify:CR=1 FL=1